MRIFRWRSRPPQDPLCAEVHRAEISPDSAAAAAHRRTARTDVGPLDFLQPADAKAHRAEKIAARHSTGTFFFARHGNQSREFRSLGAGPEDSPTISSAEI